MATHRQPSAASGTRPGGAPIPREHGAWAMLYAPVVACLLGLHPPAVPFVAFVACVTAVFFGQNAAGLVARGRGSRRCWAWLASCAIVTAATGSLLVFGYGFVDLVWPGALGAVLLGRALAVSLGSGKRIDRSVLGEVLSVGGLALTGPAAYVVSMGGLDAVAVVLWLAFWSKYVSGVSHVKMLVGSMKAGREASRWRLGRGLLVYHLALLAVTVWGLVWLGWPVGALAMAAYVPLLVRAAVARWRLGRSVPKLKTVGMLELSYTVWFVAFAAAALHRLAASP